jgi:peptide/nickel transport system substrate-binding protein
VDRLLNSARAVNEFQSRKAFYDDAQEILQADLPIIYLYHPTWLWAMRSGVEGFTPYPDGMIRLEGVRVAR